MTTAAEKLFSSQRMKNRRKTSKRTFSTCLMFPGQLREKTLAMKALRPPAKSGSRSMAHR